MSNASEWQYSEWQHLSEGEKAIYLAFSAPKVNNIPQIPEENTTVLRGEDYIPKNDDVVVFINVDGTLNETPNPNEIMKFTEGQRNAITLWLTEGYGNDSEEEEEGEIYSGDCQAVLPFPRDHGVYSHDMALTVNQGSPGVSTVDAGLGLEHVFTRDISVIIDLTADRSRGERPESSLLGVTDGYNRVTDGNQV